MATVQMQECGFLIDAWRTDYQAIADAECTIIPMTFLDHQGPML